MTPSALALTSLRSSPNAARGTRWSPEAPGLDEINPDTVPRGQARRSSARPPISRRRAGRSRRWRLRQTTIRREMRDSWQQLSGRRQEVRRTLPRRSRPTRSRGASTGSTRTSESGTHADHRSRNCRRWASCCPNRCSFRRVSSCRFHGCAFAATAATYRATRHRIADGSLAGPLGKVGLAVSLEQAQQSARLTALSILGSLKRELGDLDPRYRVAQGLRHGEFRARLRSAAPRHQRILANSILELYGRAARQPRAFSRRHGRVAVRHSGRDRSGGRDRRLMHSHGAPE